VEAVYRARVTEKLCDELSAEFVKEVPVLQGFRLLHDKIGRSNRRFPSAPESLVQFFLSRGVIPQLNVIVDIYNCVSLESRLALGAHDTRFIDGNVELRMSDDSEVYKPLGAAAPRLLTLANTVILMKRTKSFADSNISKLKKRR